MTLSHLITTILSIAQVSTNTAIDELSTTLNKSLNCTSTPSNTLCLIGAQFNYLNSVCSPPSTNASLDLTYPCNQSPILQDQCVFGRTFDEIWNSTSGEYVSDIKDAAGWEPQSVSNQRLCACESDFFDVLVGCSDCYSAHGAEVALFDDKAVSSISSSYCAASSTPTAGLDEVLNKYYNGKASSILSAASAETQTSTMTDPLAGSLAVSYYYTPTVTGSAVFDIAGVTHGAKPTETNVKDGQITGGAGTSFGGDIVTVKVAAAAMLGLGAVIAML